MKVIVGGIIKNQNNEYLLVKERKEDYYGMYNLPAGHLEENELLLDGAKREIKEETGYDVDIKGIVQIGNTKQFISFIFYCETTSVQEEFQENEIIETKWLKYSAVLNIKDKLRSADLILDAIKKVEENKISKLEIIK